MNIKFLTPATIKEIFDSLRNVGISAAILYIGYTLKSIPAQELENPTITHTYGWILIISSFLLLALCVIYCYEKLKATPDLNKAIVISLSFFFAAITCLIFLATPMSHGATY